MSETCACGHVYDEHDDSLACTIDGCRCFYFDPGDDEHEPFS